MNTSSHHSFGIHLLSLCLGGELAKRLPAKLHAVLAPVQRPSASRSHAVSFGLSGCSTQGKGTVFKAELNRDVVRPVGADISMTSHAVAPVPGPPLIPMPGINPDSSPFRECDFPSNATTLLCVEAVFVVSAGQGAGRLEPTASVDGNGLVVAAAVASLRSGVQIGFAWNVHV